MYDLAGRIDYIKNPDRQEHLYTTYCTTNDSDFWTELIEENQREFHKYNCGGKCVEAREWIIALEESLVQENPNKIIRAFVDAFKEKYGVECVAALHHNKSKTNYHIHLIFADRKLLAEPVIKVAERRMYYDEQGRHSRTKKAVCDSDGSLREGCNVIEKGEVYEKTIFAGKVEHFKERAFQEEVKQLFTEINNSFIKDKSRQLQVFDRDSVYLPTKKIGKNNPREEQIKANNAVRQEWNRAADGALVSGVPEKDIMAVKHKQISEEIRDSIHKAGNQPGLFADVLKRAIETLRGLTCAARVPEKPKLMVDLREFREMGTLKESLNLIQGQIAKLDKRITAKQAYIDKLTYPWKKVKALKELSELVNRRGTLEDSLVEAVKKVGYPSVQRFMKTYQKSVAAIRQYEKEYAAYKEAVEKGLVVDPEVKVSIRKQLKEFQEKGKIKRQTKESVKNIIHNEII